MSDETTGAVTGGSVPPYKPASGEDLVLLSPGGYMTEPVRGYGDIMLKTHHDGTVTVDYADDVIAISTELLARIDSCHIDGDLFMGGVIVADTAGEYRYRPVRFAEQGHVVICERVR